MRRSRSSIRIAAALLALSTALGCTVALAQDQDEQRAQWLAETFPANGRDLAIEVGDADVVVRNGDVDEITFEVWFRARDLNAARDRVERMNFRAEDDGNTVRILSDAVDDDWRDWDWRRWGSFDVVVEAIVPEAIDAHIVSGDGDVSVQRLNGRITVIAEDGDVLADSLTGSIELRSNDGDLGVRSVGGASLIAHTDDGDVTLGDLTSGTVDIHTDDGDIQGTRLSAGSSQVVTGDGDIVMDSVAGEFDARTGDGDIHVSIDRLDSTSLTTTEGDITIRAGAQLAANLDLRGPGLSMREAVRANFKGRVERRLIEGALNGGGPALQARTQDGTIVLRLNRD
ncbi:MAG: DUF4097 family beta strand repeat protein [Acidobacteria bacterium]|nr:DUF4097 family beta strand repeat protein [Acidobacteriota bacterium]